MNGHEPCVESDRPDICRTHWCWVCDENHCPTPPALAGPHTNPEETP